MQHSSEWLQDHQDKDNQTDLTHQAILNIRMEHAAKTAYDLPQHWQTDTYVPIMQAEVCAVYIDDCKITSNVHLPLAERWHERDARAYLTKRHSINADLFQTIYWNPLRFALKNLSVHRRATAVKAFHHNFSNKDA